MTGLFLKVVLHPEVLKEIGGKKELFSSRIILGQYLLLKIYMHSFSVYAFEHEPR